MPCNTDKTLLTSDFLQALVYSNCAPRNPELHDIVASTKGVLYFGTPHLGSDWSSLHRIILNIGRVFTTTNTRIVQHLVRESDHLMKLQAQYNHISGIFKTVSFYEEYPISLPAGKAALVCHTPRL